MVFKSIAIHPFNESRVSVFFQIRREPRGLQQLESFRQADEEFKQQEALQKEIGERGAIEVDEKTGEVWLNVGMHPSVPEELKRKGHEITARKTAKKSKA
jgi:hypothetical protein